MPHARKRHALNLLLKKLKFSPVIAVQGARQTGKSFLIRNLLSNEISELVYKTFDETALRRFAEQNPDTFLDQFSEAKPLAVDEAQKVPQIFDAVKLEVDEDRKPGRYILLGSTEFSKLSRIRESLTGRMSRIRLYPLNLGEAFEKAENPSPNQALIQTIPRITRKEFLTYLSRGGLPALFGIRNEAERQQQTEDWLALTLERDVHSFRGISIESTLCREILEQIAKLPEPNATHLAKILRQNTKVIQRHLNVLSSLFVLHKLDPHRLGTGKPCYFLCDVALAKLLGAPFERQLQTWLLQEQLSQRSYRQDQQNKLYFYRTTKGSMIHLIVEGRDGALSAIKIFSEEKLDLRELEVLKAFRRKSPDPSKTSLYGLGPSRFSISLEDGKNKKLEIFPWESIG